MDIHHSDCRVLPLDVLDVSEQRVSLHVGGRLTHVSDVPGACKCSFLGVTLLFPDTGLLGISLVYLLFLSDFFPPPALLLAGMFIPG